MEADEQEQEREHRVGILAHVYVQGTEKEGKEDGATYLDKRPFGPAHKVLELVLHGRHDRRLDRHEQVLLRRVVLQHGREAVVDLAVDAAEHAQERHDGLGPPEEQQCLVERVASWKTPRQQRRD